MTSKMIKGRGVRLMAIEIFLYLAVVISWFSAKKFLKMNINDEYLIDVVFFIALALLIFMRSGHQRLFWYGFSGLVLSAISDTSGFSTITFFLSSFSISFFALGILNSLLFNRNNLKD